MRSGTQHATIAAGLLTAFAATVMAATPADTACQTVAQALVRIWEVPNHQYMTSSGAGSGGGTGRSEQIITRTATYFMVDGKWSKGPEAPQEEQQSLSAALEKMKGARCTHLRDETVDGQPTSVYAVHNETEYGTSDPQIWISGKGLPVRQELDLTAAGAHEKSHNSVRFTYTDVQPPAGL